MAFDGQTVDFKGEIFENINRVRITAGCGIVTRGFLSLFKELTWINHFQGWNHDSLSDYIWYANSKIVQRRNTGANGPKNGILFSTIVEILVYCIDSAQFPYFKEYNLLACALMATKLWRQDPCWKAMYLKL